MVSLRSSVLLLVLLVGCDGGSTGTDSGPLGDGGGPTDSGATAASCEAQTLDLTQGLEAGILEARLCYDADTNTCAMASGQPAAVGCMPLGARWARNEGVTPPNLFIDTLPSQSFLDATHGTVAAPGFYIEGIELGTPSMFTLVTADSVELRVSYVMTETTVTIGPVFRR